MLNTLGFDLRDTINNKVYINKNERTISMAN